LTVDHYHPRSNGGPDDLDNLLYCCARCNQHKADYWPMQPGDPALWHPRREPIQTHLLTLVDGTLHPITVTGAFTLRRLRLNCPPLVAHRLRKLKQAEESRLLAHYRVVTLALAQLQEQHAALLE
jgi:hypothetical protein